MCNRYKPRRQPRSIAHKARRTHRNGAGLQNSMQAVQVTTQAEKAPQIERKAGVWRTDYPTAAAHTDGKDYTQSGAGMLYQHPPRRQRVAATHHKSTGMQCFCKDFLQNVCIYQKKAVPLQYQKLKTREGKHRFLFCLCMVRLPERAAGFL